MAKKLVKILTTDEEIARFTTVHITASLSMIVGVELEPEQVRDIYNALLEDMANFRNTRELFNLYTSK